MSSYNDPSSQGSMLFDAYRNQFYYDALKAVITPDSVVLDLGAGLGGFGLMAARLGAKAVYLVDPSPAVLVAGEVAKANGINNVQCFHGAIESVVLPSKVDVIISVFTGNFLLSEDLLPSLFYARDKYLQVDGHLIPDKAKMMAAPAQVDDFYQRSLLQWERNDGMLDLGLDYQLTMKYAVNRVYHDDYRSMEPVLLAKQQVLTEIDFHTATKAECFSENSYSVERAGVCHGWLGWFQMQLGASWMSTGPEAPASHWSQVLLPLERRLDLAVNDVLSLRLQRPQFGDYSWQTRGVASFKQSTFLSQPIVPALIAKQADTYQPKLSDGGVIAKLALTLFDGNASVKDISVELRLQHQKTFKTEAAATEYVKAMVLRYS